MLIRAQKQRDWDSNIKLGSFERVWSGVNLGMLKGNRFSVALRFIDRNIDNAMIKSNVENVKKNGFVNYFGMQRFGSYSIRTHQIGKEILNHNWEEVIRLILIQHADFIPGAKARKERITNLVFNKEAAGNPAEMRDNIEDAMDLLDRKDRIEKVILQSLAGSPNGYYNAF